MEKFIHIHAVCKAFEIHEQVKESKAVSRLIKIRNNFTWSQNRGESTIPNDNLVVKTKLVNPEFQFTSIHSTK